MHSERRGVQTHAWRVKPCACACRPRRAVRRPAMDLAALVAREAIRDIVARYAHAADRGRFDDVAALFAEDGVLELPDGRRPVGPAAIGAFLVETSATMQVAS